MTAAAKASATADIAVAEAFRAVPYCRPGQEASMTEMTYASARAGAEEAARVMCQVVALGGAGHPLHTVDIRWTEKNGWTITAQTGVYTSEAGDIDVIRWWANTLDGGTYLAEARSHECSGKRRIYRELSARVTISGVLVEIWDHVDIHEEPIETPAVTLPSAA